MTILESLNSADVRKSEFNRQADELLSNFQKSINANVLKPSELINAYRDALCKLTRDLFNTFSMKIYVGQYKKFSIARDILHRSQHLIQFNESAFENAYKHEISILMLMYKENLLEGQLKLAAMKLLMDNFYIFSVNLLSGTDRNNPFSTNSTKGDQTWIPYMYNLENTINYILEYTQIIDLPVIADQTPGEYFVNNISKPNFTLTKPTRVEHLTGLWCDGMSRPDRVRAVAAYYGCCEKQARRWMKLFNVYDEDIIDYKKLYEESLIQIEQLKDENKRIREYNEYLQKQI